MLPRRPAIPEAGSEPWRRPGLPEGQGRAGAARLKVSPAAFAPASASARPKEESTTTTTDNGLRPLATRELLARGVSLKVASMRLGHSREALTPKVYAHRLPSADKELQSKLEFLHG
jgi:hypothetical protein